MAQFYTLEEAAQRLNIPAEEFKRKLKTEWTTIRPFRDGATLRFRAADIDELARSLGAASDPGLPLGPVGAGLTESSDDFALAPDAPTKSGSDSDVRLDLSTPGKPTEGGTGQTEEIALDVSGPPSSGVLKPSSSAKLKGTKSGKDVSTKSGSKLGKDESGKIPSATDSGSEKTDSSSEFELSLDSDSDSFELQLTNDSSEEMALGSNPNPDDSGRQSGIDLGKPADSGVSLEKKKPGSSANDADSDVDFELSLDPTGASGVRLGGPKSGPPKSKPRPKPEDSSSEFELTLDDSSGNMDSLAASLQEKPEEGKGDIFETDFELPVMQDESGSEVVAVDSDTDLESGGFEVDVGDAATDDESASQVVLIDEDDAGVLVSDDEDALGGVSLDDGSSASKALRGVRDEDDGAVRTIVAGPAKWGPVPVIPLMMTLPIAFLGLLMAFELLQTSKGYSSGTKPGGTISRGIADLFGMKIND